MRALAITLFALFLLYGQASGSRLKDLTSMEGARDNQLVGYGLVVGLNGTGDSDKTQFTIQSLVNMLERMGVTVTQNDVKVDNVAAVIVTADLGPFSKLGSRMDVTISSIGDADSLAGGTLLMTPLRGPDGDVYAVAQGPVVVGSLSFGGKAAKVQKNHPTVGRIPDGALIEKESPSELPNGQFTLRLKAPDFTTMARMSEAINGRFGQNTARAEDASSINVTLPDGYSGKRIRFLAELEAIEISPDTPARIVVNEKTGTIVMGEEVRIDTVAVSHGNLSLIISEGANVSQPQPFSAGQTVPVAKTDITVNEDEGNLTVMDMGVSIGEISRALNAIGASPRDLIAILQAIKAAGALHADLKIL